MFGNIINYTQSPGGIRRGLIYQSSSSKGENVYDTVIRLNALYGRRSGGNTQAYLYFERNGDISFRVNQSSYASSDFPVNAYTLASVWYPIEIIPVYTLGIGNNVIDLESMETYINNTYTDVNVKRQNLIVTVVDNSWFTITALIVYYNISNVPIINIGSGQYYDIKNHHADRIWKLNGFKQYIKLNSDTNISIKCDTRFFTHPQANIGSVTLPSGATVRTSIKYDELKDAYCEYTGKIWFEQVQGSTIYEPKTQLFTANIKSSDPIFIEKNTSPYGLPFLLPPTGANVECYIHVYDASTHQTLPTIRTLNPTLVPPQGQSDIYTSPNNLILREGVFMPGSRLSDIALNYETLSFRHDFGTYDPNNLSNMWYLNLRLPSALSTYQANSFDESVNLT